MSSMNILNSLEILKNDEYIKSKTSLNLKKIEFLDGSKLSILKRNAFDNLAKDPLVGFSNILTSIESSIYSPLPESLLRTNVSKFLLEENLYIIEADSTYKFRPDLISQIFYGSNEYFHLVLMANGMKTFLEFIPEKYNHLILVFKPKIISSILNF